MLFDEQAQALRVDRAKRRQQRATPFLLERAIDDLSERLQDVNRTFSRACLIGPFDWRDQILDRLPVAKRFAQFDYRETPGGDAYDLVISLFHIQSLNTVGGWMQAARAMLIPDGLFLACLIGGISLTELRQTLYAIDTDRIGSPTPRIHPMIEVRAAAQLLGHAGLAIPVTDSDRFAVHYRQIETLAGDLRDLGLSNALTDRSAEPAPRLITDIEARLRPAPDRPMPISWEIVWMTGWAPHDSQQKPLKPGSAKIGLNEALKSIRDR
ncbi:methyltransferase [Algimonas porphyrae]|uniref:Methyltransferase n=1 Tax=Algimonas porphyrae TaxID=1128113 RepID=A0ABQ5V4J3_9PROT|nr:methyltransferase [Algimonas porphyrae]